MKFDLTTTIITAIVGVAIAYIAASNIMGQPEEVSIKTLKSSVDVNLTDPNPEVFNYRALNPTVETYIGNECQNYDNENNICLDNNNINEGDNGEDENDEEDVEEENTDEEIIYEETPDEDIYVEEE